MIKSNSSPPPTSSTTFWNVVSFHVAVVLVLTITAPFVLPVKIIHMKPAGQQAQFVGWNDGSSVGARWHDWTTRSYSSFHANSPVQKDVIATPAGAAGITQTTSHQLLMVPMRVGGDQSAPGRFSTPDTPWPSISCASLCPRISRWHSISQPSIQMLRLRKPSSAPMLSMALLTNICIFRLHSVSTREFA
jgi:hypothetical protein